MEAFQLWFETGLEHILDLKGYDHILYVVAFSILFSHRQWKPLFWLVTAFTLGHSLTLALSTMNVLDLPQSVVEIAIVLTILISCMWNLLDLRRSEPRVSYRYVTAVVFGCIHGLGFSYLLKSMLGREESIVLPLLYFNLGLEAGQLVILSAVVGFKAILLKFWPIYERIIATTITFVILAVAVYLLLLRVA
ncbi:MAG TPA: HupE/UreJ family protein [Saprospiraceae bacterium]|nr:HupE/UreJ family protein [Saprospiraceae bacterium]